MQDDQAITKLRGWMRTRSSAVVAFSGGVDSSVLACAAHLELGARATAVTVHYESFPQRERLHAARTAASIGIRHVTVPSTHLSDANYTANNAQRCFLCRDKVAHSLMLAMPDEEPGNFLVGVTSSDLAEDRPGIKATRDAGFSHPFLDLDMDKEAVRGAARALGLAIADRPSMACLSSRIARGMEIDAAKLELIDGMERRLLDLGLAMVRFRLRPDGPCIEVAPSDIPIVESHSHTIQSWLDESGVPHARFAIYKPGGALTQ